MTTTYAVRCPECRATVRMTENLRESYQGQKCEACKVVTPRHSHEYTTWRSRGPQHCKVCGRVER